MAKRLAVIAAVMALGCAGADDSGPSLFDCGEALRQWQAACAAVSPTRADAYAAYQAACCENGNVACQPMPACP